MMKSLTKKSCKNWLEIELPKNQSKDLIKMSLIEAKFHRIMNSCSLVPEQVLSQRYLHKRLSSTTDTFSKAI